MKMKRTVLAVVCVMVLGAAVAPAQDTIIDSVLKACEPEITEYCSRVTLGEGRLLACFYAHEDKLSGACQYALYDAAAQLDAFATAVTYVATSCHDELLKFCGDVQLGEGRVGTCLLEHKAEAGAECQKAIADVGFEMVEETPAAK